MGFCFQSIRMLFLLLHILLLLLFNSAAGATKVDSLALASDVFAIKCAKATKCNYSLWYSGGFEPNGI